MPFSRHLVTLTALLVFSCGAFCFPSAHAAAQNATSTVQQPETAQPKPDLNEPDLNKPDLNKPNFNESLFPLDTHKLDEENSRFFSELINTLATLGLVIALLLIIAWFLKRMVNTRIEKMNVDSRIKIVERRMLSQKSALYLIEVEGTTFLITESQNGSSSALELKSAPPADFKKFL
jgi:flagellar biogenesis protein FliO